MALASLKFEQSREMDETRQGYVIYNGAPSRFHEWEFRTMMKHMATQDDDKKRNETTAQIIDSLRGDAATLAMDLGAETLMKKDGIPR